MNTNVISLQFAMLSFISSASTKFSFNRITYVQPAFQLSIFFIKLKMLALKDHLRCDLQAFYWAKSDRVGSGTALWHISLTTWLM